MIFCSRMRCSEAFGRSPAVKIFLRIVAIVVCCFLATCLGVCGWFFLYSGDLPQLNEAARYAPEAAQTVSSVCAPTPTVAIPYSLIAENLRDAITTVESAPRSATLRLQLARMLLCNERGRIWKRQLKELRLANQLGRRFSPNQVLTMYANRVYLGDGTIGVEAASRRLFGKSASQLSLAEAAMIAGLARAPNFYSPQMHRDRAIMRRDQVIEALRIRGVVSDDEATKAKSAPLKTVD